MRRLSDAELVRANSHGDYVVRDAVVQHAGYPSDSHNGYDASQSSRFRPRHPMRFLPRFQLELLVLAPTDFELDGAPK